MHGRVVWSSIPAWQSPENPLVRGEGSSGGIAKYWDYLKILLFSDENPETAEGTAMPRARVLVVEVDQLTRQIVRQTLDGEGYDVVEVDNAEEGTKAMRP